MLLPTLSHAHKCDDAAEASSALAPGPSLGTKVGYGAPSADGAGAGSRVDLRSDTVTKPTPAMHAAMRALAEHPERLGDDVFREDPTVHALEQ